MSSELKQVFAYTNFPLTQDAPAPVFEFRRTQGHFPGKVVVNFVTAIPQSDSSNGLKLQDDVYYKINDTQTEG